MSLPRLATTHDFDPHFNSSFTILPYPGSTAADDSQTSEPSPPEYSPITPKTLPATPAIATIEQSSTNQSTIVDTTVDQRDGEADKKIIAPTQYVPAPSSRPFSSDESVDALALKAAISSLQFQRQKAREDIKTLEHAKTIAMEDPEHFAKDLVSGKLKEKRRDFGSLEDITDETEEHVAITIPGPQDVVRMPNVNWDKYNIMGEPLDAMHEQQRRWPGATAFQGNKGREYSVTAPYSPFYDTLDSQPSHTRNVSDGSRKDSTPTSTDGTPITGEHPYETRRNSKHHV